METKLTKDEMVKQLFDQLLLKKAEVAKATKPTYITGGNFRYTEGSPAGIVDITTVKNEHKLVEIASFLKERTNSYKQAAEELGCDVSFTWLGFTKEEWMTDLKTRVNVLQIAKRKAELAEAEDRLNKVMPQEMKDQMELEALTAMLK